MVATLNLQNANTHGPLSVDTPFLRPGLAHASPTAQHPSHSASVRSNSLATLARLSTAGYLRTPRARIEARPPSARSGEHSPLPPRRLHQLARPLAPPLRRRVLVARQRRAACLRVRQASAVLRPEADAAPVAVERDLVVQHVDRAEDERVLVVVEDAQAVLGRRLRARARARGRQYG
eukprot:878580-Pleurochrysis_carterae.AAC.2